MSEHTCPDCGARWEASDDWLARFAARGLPPPKRCSECRARRRTRGLPAPVRQQGAVLYVHPDSAFGKIELVDGERVFFTAAALMAGEIVRVGDRVECEVADGRPSRVAHAIRRCDGVSDGLPDAAP